MRIDCARDTCCALQVALVLAMIAGSVRAGPANAATEVRGRIVDSLSGIPVPLARVTLIELDLAAITGSDGRFSFKNLRPGSYTLVVVRDGYEERREDIGVRSDKALDLDLPIRREIIELEAIVVTPGTYSFMETGTAGRQTMSREDMESVPQIGEDVFRAVNRMPGLASGDYAAHFSIRGGRHDETLILLDGLEVHEPFHLKDFNEGAISIIDVETIDGVELMTGGFPAHYGNKRSGVFNITSRTPELDQAQYSLGISFMNARAMARGPLWNGKGSWLISARSGYMDLVFKLIQQDDLPSPRYHDVFAKLAVDLNRNHTLSVDVLHAGDKYTYDAASTTGFQDTLATRENAKNHYGNSYLWTTLQSALGRHTTVRTMLSAGLVTRSRDGFERYVDSAEPIYNLSNQRDYSIGGFYQDWTHTFSKKYILTYGIDARLLHNKDAMRSVVGQDPNDPEDPAGNYPVIVNTSIEETGTRLSAYLSNRLRIIDPLVLEVGGRYDGATYTHDRDFTPRVGAALDIGGNRTLRAAWGYYRQMQGIDDVSALNTGQSYYPSELTELWAVGLEQRFSNGAFGRIELYLKDGSDLRPVYRNWKGGIDTFPETNEDRILVYPTTSRARGVELYYDHRLGKRINMRASYTFSMSEEGVDRIDNVNSPDPLTYDAEHPTPQDQRHAANADFTYKPGRLWSLNGSLAFHTGWPTTEEELISVLDENGQPDLAVRPSKLYGSRLPAYFRFDVRATRRWTTSRGDMRFFVELINLSNHTNVFGYDYVKANDGGGSPILQQDEETWFTILPSVGIAWNGSF